MLVLPGASVFHPPQRAALLSRIQALNPSISSVDAVFLHFVEPETSSAAQSLADPSSSERKVLDALLKYGDDYALEGTRQKVDSAIKEGKAEEAIWVVPRAGTISPWSSKATDIAKMCTLDGVVRRIERGLIFVVKADRALQVVDLGAVAHFLHDRMTQLLLDSAPEPRSLFERGQPGPLKSIEISGKSVADAKEKLVKANQELGLALGGEELDYLVECFLASSAASGRNPTDVELFMFAQVNSEHCRHKIFNASWVVDGQTQDLSLRHDPQHPQTHSRTHHLCLLRQRCRHRWIRRSSFRRRSLFRFLSPRLPSSRRAHAYPHQSRNSQPPHCRIPLPRSRYWIRRRNPR